MRVRVLGEDGDDLTDWYTATLVSEPGHIPNVNRVELRDLLGRVAANTAGLRECTLEIVHEEYHA